MIPKKIHYCWFGRKELPEKAKKCIASWKKYCPDFEIIEWNEDNFDVYQNAYGRVPVLRWIIYGIAAYVFASNSGNGDRNPGSMQMVCFGILIFRCQCV